jgi:two-component system, NarL family, nitrate/nitrite response regulator NarL
MLVRMVAIRVLVVSDDPLARGGLTALLGERETVAVVEDDPDVVVWDVSESADGITRTKAPLLAVLADESQAAEARAAGARGLLLRSASGEQLAAAAVAVANGLNVVDPVLAGTLFRTEAATDSPVEDLTPREMEVLQLLAQGLTNKRIAERLHISDHTAKFHVNAILGKLGVQSRTEAIVQAARRGLVIL